MSTQSTKTQLTDEQAARLERLTARPGSIRPEPARQTGQMSEDQTLTDEQTARLQRLAARRSAGSESAASGAASPDAALDERIRALAERSNARTEATGPAKKSSKRRHAAKGARIAALGLSLLTTGGMTAGFLLSDPAIGSASAGVVASPTLTPGGVAGVNGTSAAASTTAASPTAASASPPASQASAAAPQPTVVNGDAVRNRFGTVQVQATFDSSGRLADVNLIQVPDGDRRSARISDVAGPMLNSEALTAQSANVDTISGATYTSRSYEQSLQSAIDIARANSITNIG